VSLTTRAEVQTDRPSPYLKQVCKHFRHKRTVEFTDSDGTMTFPFGTCRLRAEGTTLTLVGEAADVEALDVLERVVGGHLERFGRRDALTVTWTRDAAPA
jgi:hypothetical protein